MHKIVLLLALFSSQVNAESFEDARNKILFEKLHSQNQKLWTFINRKKKKEDENKVKFSSPTELQISYAKPKAINQKSIDSGIQQSSLIVSKDTKSYPNYLVSDPADDDLNYGNEVDVTNPPRPKGWQSGDDIQDDVSSSSSPTVKLTDSQELSNKNQYPIIGNEGSVENSSKQKLDTKPNALQRAWNSLVNVAKSMARPKPLTRDSQRRNFKEWSFQIGLRNLINNDSDGFRHDAEVYHQLGYRIDDRQKILVERKSVTMTGDGFGKVTRTGVGYQHYLKSVNEISDYYPYFTLFYDHWKGTFDNFNGVPTVNSKSSRDILTTRLGIEVPLTNTTNLDFYWERGKKFLNYTDVLGTKIEIHARNNLYGMGLSHSF